MLQYVTTQGSPFKGNLSPAVVIREGNCLNVFACGICHNVTMLQCHNVTISQCYNVTMLQCYNVTMLPIAYVTMNMLHSHQHPRGQSFLAYIMYVTICYNMLQCSICTPSLELLAISAKTYFSGSERSLHPLNLETRSSFVSKVKQSDGCRPKPCKWSPPQWVEAKISRTRIATRHNARFSDSLALGRASGLGNLTSRNIP